MVDGRLQHLAVGREPEAVVDELGIFRHQLVLEVRGAAVERDAFDTTMRPRIDFAAGRFIHPARLHADEAVLDEVETPDAVLAAQEIGRASCRGRVGQSVYIWLVAVSFKKKEQVKYTRYR